MGHRGEETSQGRCSETSWQAFGFLPHRDVGVGGAVLSARTRSPTYTTNSPGPGAAWIFLAFPKENKLSPTNVSRQNLYPTKQTNLAPIGRTQLS